MVRVLRSPLGAAVLAPLLTASLFGVIQVVRAGPNETYTGCLVLGDLSEVSRRTEPRNPYPFPTQEVSWSSLSRVENQLADLQAQIDALAGGGSASYYVVENIVDAGPFPDPLVPPHFNLVNLAPGDFEVLCDAGDVALGGWVGIYFDEGGYVPGDPRADPRPDVHDEERRSRVREGTGWNTGGGDQPQQHLSSDHGGGHRRLHSHE